VVVLGVEVGEVRGRRVSTALVYRERGVVVVFSWEKTRRSWCVQKK
jgi:hypothetical protein